MMRLIEGFVEGLMQRSNAWSRALSSGECAAARCGSLLQTERSVCALNHVKRLLSC